MNNQSNLVESGQILSKLIKPDSSNLTLWWLHSFKSSYGQIKIWNSNLPELSYNTQAFLIIFIYFFQLKFLSKVANGALRLFSFVWRFDIFGIIVCTKDKSYFTLTTSILNWIFFSVQVDFVIRVLFTDVKLVKKAKLLVKMCLFICEFSIRGPKYQDISTAKNKVHLKLSDPVLTSSSKVARFVRYNQRSLNLDWLM